MAIVIDTKKTVPETLADLRRVFRKTGLEDYEPVPADDGPGYSVRYRQNGQPWATISSTIQPRKAQNLRVCYDVIFKLFLWAERGVSGVSQGVTFIGTALEVGDDVRSDSVDEAFFTIGVEPTDDLEMIEAVYRTKIKRIHPDTIRDPDEKKQAEARAARLNKAMELVRKVKRPVGATT